MAKDEKFSHIKVTPEEEDDIVIQAGIPTLAGEDALEEAEWEESVQADAMAHSEELLEQEEADDETFFEEGIEDDESVEPMSQPAPQSATRQNKKDDYQPTTLEDLQSSKMPMTQIVVIIVALVAVIAFSVYWFGFHPSQTATDEQVAAQTEATQQSDSTAQTDAEAENESENWDSETS